MPKQTFEEIIRGPWGIDRTELVLKRLFTLADRRSQSLGSTFPLGFRLFLRVIPIIIVHHGLGV